MMERGCVFVCQVVGLYVGGGVCVGMRESVYVCVREGMTI